MRYVDSSLGFGSFTKRILLSTGLPYTATCENKMLSLEECAKRARDAATILSCASSDVKNACLEQLSKALIQETDGIVTSNAADLERGRTLNLDAPLMKRLDVSTPGKVKTLAAYCDAVRELDDPVGTCTMAKQLDSGLNLYRVSCPIGVICIIFESRPDAAVQIAALCIKSGNACILKGGKEAVTTNSVLVKTIRSTLAASGLPEDAVQLVETREQVKELLALHEYIDLVIPRGSKAMVRNVMAATSIPVLGHADGVCHCFVDERADAKKAVDIVVDSKTQYTTVCNATETLLIHKKAMPALLPAISDALVKKGVKINASKECASYISGGVANVLGSSDGDWFATEYLGLEISVVAVASLDEAIHHINKHGSHHTDCIITEDTSAAEIFMQRVDSAGVFHNASTRFADGFRYGFGSEVGVSTNRIHARGPCGLESLLIYKYKLRGSGHCVAGYCSGKDKFHFKPLGLRDDNK